MENKLEYFVAHAPMPPPPWFERLGEMQNIGPVPHEMSDGGDEYRHRWLETEAQHWARWAWHYGSTVIANTPTK